jgi:hypothetical protein
LKSLSLPSGDGDSAASANLIASREASASMDLLPTDDEPDDLGLPAEEQALHAVHLGTERSEAIPPGDLERAEARDAEVRSDERFEALRGEEVERAEVEAAVGEEAALVEAASRRRDPLWRRLVRPERRRGAERGWRR